MSKNNADSDFGQDFKVYTDFRQLPLKRHPTYLKEGFTGVCTSGSAVFDVFSNKHKLVKNELIVMLPHQLAFISEITEDFSITFFKVPYPLFHETLSGICRFTIDFFFYMRRNYCFPLSEEETERFIHFCYLLRYRADTPEQFFRKESIMTLLRVFYFDIYIFYKSEQQKSNSFKRYSHKEEITFKFFNLIIENYVKNKDVNFYAEKLHISPKYLTMVVKEVTGKSAKDWITECILLEIKSLLRNSTIEIKEIVYKIGFMNQSSMSRFFRKHTGISPSKYRNEAHYIH